MTVLITCWYRVGNRGIRVVECMCTGIISYSACGKLMLFIFCTLVNKPVKSTIVEDTLFSSFHFGQHTSARFVGKPTGNLHQSCFCAMMHSESCLNSSNRLLRWPWRSKHNNISENATLNIPSSMLLYLSMFTKRAQKILTRCY